MSEEWKKKAYQNILQNISVGRRKVQEDHWRKNMKPLTYHMTNIWQDWWWWWWW